MADILHHLLFMKYYENWDILHLNWCRIPSINSTTQIAHQQIPRKKDNKMIKTDMTSLPKHATAAIT